MDLKQAKVLLEKIDRLMQSMSTDSGRVSAIEKDLMLNYIRELYETFISADTRAKGESRQYQAPAMERKYTPPSPKPTFEVVTPKGEKPPVPPPPKREVRYEPRPTPTTQLTSRPLHENTRQPASPPVDFDTLFEQEQAKELADKLSGAPISDLTKAFSINDRILYANELFGGDLEKFSQTLNKLNTFASFEKAKSYLSGEIANAHNWTDKDRKKMARDFIKIIRRRY